MLLALFYLLPALDSTQRGREPTGSLCWWWWPSSPPCSPSVLCWTSSVWKNTLYAITDRRVIALVKDDPMYIPLGAEARCLCGGTGPRLAATLCFGEGRGLRGAENRRSNAVLGIRGRAAARMIYAGDAVLPCQPPPSSFCAILPDAGALGALTSSRRPNFPEQPLFQSLSPDCPFLFARIYRPSSFRQRGRSFYFWLNRPLPSKPALRTSQTLHGLFIFCLCLCFVQKALLCRTGRL